MTRRPCSTFEQMFKKKVQTEVRKNTNTFAHHNARHFKHNK